jgi:protein gp37
MAKTTIEWADYTFNAWRGCTKVSPECDICYAEALGKRNPAVLGVWGKYGSRPVAAENYWRQPVIWNRKAAAAGERRRVFCQSLSDVFEDDKTMPESARYNVYIARQRLFALIKKTPELYWLLLTKRPENIGNVVSQIWSRTRINLFSLPNVWLGTSVGVKKTKPRIDILRGTPAAIRFLSIEPLLEDLGELNLDGIDWVIVGGESGPNARPMHPDWVRSIRDQCVAAGVPFFFKQWGEWVPGAQNVAILNDLSDNDLWASDSGNILRCIEPNPHGVRLVKVGKKKAGRLIDGREWNEFPEVK